MPASSDACDLRRERHLSSEPQRAPSSHCTGHLMDTGILARVLDDVLEYGGDYRIESLDLGRQHEDESRALVEIRADDAELLDRILMRVQVHGANPVDPGDGADPAGADRRRLPRRLLLDDQPRHLRPAGPASGCAVEQPEMDCGLVVEDGTAGRSSAPCRSATCGPARRSSAARTACGWSCRRPSPRGEEENFGFMSLDGVQREAAGAAGPPDRRADARGQGRRASGSCGSAARRSCTPAPRRRWSRAGATPATSTSCSPATRWPRTTSSPRCYGTSLGVDLAQGLGRAARARAPHPRDQHDPRGRLDRRGGGVRACSPAGSCTRWCRPASRSCWSARCATTARCPTSTPT